MQERITSGDPRYLPVFGDGVPYSHFARVAGGDELVSNEEQSLHRHIQTEHTCGAEHTGTLVYKHVWEI